MKIKTISRLLVVALLAVFVSSCSENIDDSDYAIKEEPTMADFLDENPDLSLINSVFKRVRLGRSESASSIYAVLSARGHYTLFAPNNDAVRAYCQATVGSEDPANLSYEQAQLIAYSCIIDNGNSEAYESVEFPQNGSFILANLYDRLLSCTELTDSTRDEPFYRINGSSDIISADHQVSNGYVHIVNSVIAPSAENVAELIKAADNMHIMGKLLDVTGIANLISAERDAAYEDDPNLPEKRYWSSVAFKSGNNNWDIPQKRYLGFTAFVEPDSILNTQWGIDMPVLDEAGNITNWDNIQLQLEQKAAAVYTDATSSDVTSPDNALYKFVAYHFLKGKMAYNRFVHHCTEHNYKYGTNILAPQDVNYTVDVWDYYYTLDMGTDGRRGLIKVLQVPSVEDNHAIYLNRISKYDNGLQGSYEEISTTPFTPGIGINIKISEHNGNNTNNASNGYYYPISGVLTYDATTRNALGSERIRIDLTTITHELISNNYRGTQYEAFQHGYFEDIFDETEGTEIYYLQCGWNGVGYWHDFQGDEYLFSGLYDFKLRLPPVPVDGTYEIRMGSALNSLRGMCQIYFGDDPDNLLPVGLPFDLRQSTQYVSGQGAENPDIPFILDEDLGWDEELIAENDKDLRTHGYMKAPNYFWDCTYQGQVRKQGADNLPCLRRIITVDNFKANKTYYLRFKSSLKKLDSQFFVDYFELVPSSVFNGVDPEDTW